MSKSVSPVPRRMRGFTLVELMVTITVMIILMALAAPTFTGVIVRNRLTSEANEVVASLKQARSEAARRGIIIAIRSDADTGEFSGGWKVFTNSTGDGAIPDTVEDNNGTVIRTSQAMSNGLTVTRVNADLTDFTDANAEFVLFNARGGTTPSTWRVCSTARPELGGRAVRLAATGRVSVEANGIDCP